MHYNKFTELLAQVRNYCYLCEQFYYMIMVEGIIYKYTSPSGRCYIGQTTNERVRREHWNTEGPYAGRKIDRAREK